MMHFIINRRVAFNYYRLSSSPVGPLSYGGAILAVPSSRVQREAVGWVRLSIKQ